MLESRQKITKSTTLIFAPNALAQSLQLSQGRSKRKGRYDSANRDKRQRQEMNPVTQHYND